MIIRNIAIALVLLVSLPSMAQSGNKVVVISMPGDDVTHFYGPTINIPQIVVEEVGFSVCHSETYGTNSTLISTVLTKCNKPELMLACRPTGTPVFQLAAHAPRADVTFDTGDNANVTHSANGAEWYFSTTSFNTGSWGFAPLGSTVNKAACDVAAIGGAVDQTTPYRMCSHTTPNSVLDSGFRCGASLSLYDNSYERVFLHR
jgi:hypothetical protein